ncbi:MAG: PhnD/SsuA/transferrin family substrate-binding protein [Gemmataceae bacterium]|nr:PhnD/SsuA/transferrin family substrate-binding protein [Gemmataceae bacterium]MCI0739152.1 PhnD/SsuA/transferrin family substrate-binding protein [Gemmataceae bacterium]
MTHKLVCAALALATLGLASLSADAPVAPEPVKTDPVRIGLVDSLFTDVHPQLVQIASRPFVSVMRKLTGMEGQLLAGGNPYDIGKKLNDKQMDLAVFHGVEFGWAQQKYPELRPLMIAISYHRNHRAHLVVNANSQAKCLKEFRGKDLCVPLKTKDHCRLFLERSCLECGQCDSKAFFAKIVPGKNSEASLDDLAMDRIPAVLTDTIALETYERLKPGARARLRVLKESEVFPPGVIAYRQGAMDEARLRRFREGMMRANQDEESREVMGLWRLTSFEPVPDDFAQSVADIIKAYPPPDACEKVSQR